jgi:hypothetical protein
MNIGVLEEEYSSK